MAQIGAVIGLVGTFVQAAGTIAAGKAQMKAARQQQEVAEYEAKQLDIRAKEERSAAQQEAMEIARQKRLALSALQNRAAASGFMATDPLTYDLMGEIEQYGTLQEQRAQYGGRSRAKGVEAQAEGRRMSGRAALAEGRAALIGSRYAAAGTILGGLSGFTRRFGSSFTPYSAGRYG